MRAVEGKRVQAGLEPDDANNWMVYNEERARSPEDHLKTYEQLYVENRQIDRNGRTPNTARFPGAG